MGSQIAYRTEPTTADIENIREIIVSTGFFFDHEIDVAVELVEERLDKGLDESGYYFLFADTDGKTVAYACYGTIACTVGSYDLYWIATHNDYRGKGIGKDLLCQVENDIKGMGGRAIYIETSAKPQYEPTQKFYDSCRYLREALLKDFYAENDHKIIFSKNV